VAAVDEHPIFLSPDTSSSMNFILRGALSTREELHTLLSTPTAISRQSDDSDDRYSWYKPSQKVYNPLAQPPTDDFVPSINADRELVSHRSVRVCPPLPSAGQRMLQLPTLNTFCPANFSQAHAMGGADSGSQDCGQKSQTLTLQAPKESGPRAKPAAKLQPCKK